MVPFSQVIRHGWQHATPAGPAAYLWVGPDGSAGYPGSTGDPRGRLAEHQRGIERAHELLAQDMDVRVLAPVARLAVERGWRPLWIPAASIEDARDIEAVMIARHRLRDPVGPPGLGNAWMPRSPRSIWARSVALGEVGLVA